MTARVVVLGASPDDAPPGIDAADRYAEVVYAPEPGALPSTLPGADVAFAWGARRAWLEEAWPLAERLRWIQSASDGVDGLLFPALVASDVVVTNARGIFDVPIAEWALAAILMFETGLRRSILDTAAGRWGDGRTRGSVDGRRLAIVGPGPIGRAAAVRARALGMEVSAVGRTARPDDVFGAIRSVDQLHAVLAGADHVLDALPLTPSTHHLFDAAAFAAMRPGAHFVNVGRGGTVEEAALIEALRSGHLGGATLDVFEEEPLPGDSPLWSLDDVVVSPHVCGDVGGWEEQVVALFVDNLSRFVRGAPLRNLVDSGLGFGVG